MKCLRLSNFSFTLILLVIALFASSVNAQLRYDDLPDPAPGVSSFVLGSEVQWCEKSL